MIKKKNQWPIFDQICHAVSWPKGFHLYMFLSSCIKLSAYFIYQIKGINEMIHLVHNSVEKMNLDTVKW